MIQTSKNIIANTSYYLINTVISLWYTPFLLHKLGSKLFGFVPLANSVTNFFSIITYSLNISIGRFITIELEKGDTRRANQIFNTNFVATLLLISAVLPLGVALVMLAPRIFIIPPGLERDVRLLLIGVITAFLLTTYGMNYSIATFARNRFDLENFIALGSRAAQILIIVVLFRLDQPNIIYVGLGTIVAALFSLVGDYYLWRVLLPDIKINWGDFHKKILKMLFGTGAWNFLYQAGFILFLSADIFVANRMLDLNVVGMYGALLVIPKNLRIFAMAIGGVWGPSIYSKFSQSDSQGMDWIIRTSIKLTGLTLALFVGLICGLAAPFLNLWLGSDFSPMSWILVLMVFSLCTNLVDSSFFYVQVSLNKLKVPAFVTLGLGIIYLLLAILFTSHYGLLGLVFSGVLTQTLNYSLFSPIYTAIIMGLPWWHYLKYLWSVAFVTTGVAVISYALSLTVSLSSYSTLILASGLISLGYLMLIYIFGVSDAEKHMLRHLFTGSKMK